MARHVAYHRPIVDMHSWTELDKAADGFRVKQPREAAADGIRQCVAELLVHLASGFNVKLDLVGTLDLTKSDVANPLFELLPLSVFSLRTEAQLNAIAPWFMKSLEVPGDVCEIGCFRGTMAIKFAFALKALGIDKTVYAFDTFEGFTGDDPAGGRVGPGYYKVEEDAFLELTRWSRAIPVRPVKGDATETCKMLKGLQSFVWLDLDHGSLMRPRLRDHMAIAVQQNDHRGRRCRPDRRRGPSCHPRGRALGRRDDCRASPDRAEALS